VAYRIKSASLTAAGNTIAVVSTERDDALFVPLPPEAGELAFSSNQATAERAKRILCRTPDFREVSAAERSAIAAAFAARNFVVYGKAFDLVQIGDLALDLSDAAALDSAIRRSELTLIEVKSTSADRDDEFRGHFFSMSTAELLVAQSLGSLFKFAFVNTRTGNYRVVTLQDIYRRARAIYPTWSIRFDSGSFTTSP
jgi:hypothetical protein